FDSHLSSDSFTLSLHDALPILFFQQQGFDVTFPCGVDDRFVREHRVRPCAFGPKQYYSEQKNEERADLKGIACGPRFLPDRVRRDRKSTRLNSSHQIISYAVFC